jgi:hypothetical protein
MKPIRQHFFVLFMLASLFALPGLAAYIFYLHPQWLNSATTNRGRLIYPPLQLSQLGHTNAKWRFILWSPLQCDQQCQKEVDQLARVRLALGRHLYDVESYLLIRDDVSMPTAFEQQLHDEDIHVVKLSNQSIGNLPVLTQHSEIFIANADNDLMLVYPVPAKPADIFHDIKLLLKKE